MNITENEVKISFGIRMINKISNIIGAVISLILVPLIFVSKLGSKKEFKRQIVEIEYDKLKWELELERDSIKIYSCIINDWPKQLEFYDFHNGDEYLRQIKVVPEVENINKYYFGELVPYEFDTFYLEFHNGLYLYAYPINKIDKFSLLHLNFEKKELKKIIDLEMPIKHVKILNNNNLEIKIGNQKVDKIIRINNVLQYTI